MYKDIYVYLSCNDSKKYFPDNQANLFTSVLAEPLHFEGLWEVALCQITYPQTVSKARYVTVLTDIIEDSIIGERKLPILRRFNISGKNKSVTFDSLHYKPVKINPIRQLTVFTTSKDDELHPFTQGDCKVTLHFRKCLR